MAKQITKYRDCIVAREEVCACGANWEERLQQGLPAGEKRTIVTVTREHGDFNEVLLPNDPLFQEAKNATWGGTREGAGRPSTGRKAYQFYVTEEEKAALHEYLETLRAASQK